MEDRQGKNFSLAAKVYHSLEDNPITILKALVALISLFLFGLVLSQIPSALAIENNAHIMARYASVCQVHGLVPIVEPDIDVVQGDHTIEKAAQVSEKVLAAFFKVLQAQLDIFKDKYRHKNIYYLLSILSTN